MLSVAPIGFPRLTDRFQTAKCKPVFNANMKVSANICKCGAKEETKPAIMIRPPHRTDAFAVRVICESVFCFIFVLADPSVMP